MKYPSLVPSSVCKTPIKIVIESEDLSEEGAPIILLELETICNYQDKAFTMLTAEKMLITLSGKALFNGDLAPNVSVIAKGYVEVFGERRELYRGQKNRNPDGSVNFTTLEIQ